MKWFLTLTEASAKQRECQDMLKVALYTAYRRTSLEPWLIYDGQPNQFTRWLEKHNVQIIYHQTCLYPQLKMMASRSKNSNWLNCGSEVFLRADIPRIVFEQGWADEKVVYTDFDVIFTQDVVPDFREMPCHLFNAAPEMNRMNVSAISTGVMLINPLKLCESHTDFIKFITESLPCCYPLLEQAAYISYYLLDWETLEPVFNWHPLWGPRTTARIIHFHDLKPTDVEDARAGLIKPGLKPFACAEYFHQAQLWRNYLAEANLENFIFQVESPQSLTSTRPGLPLMENFYKDWHSVRGALAIKLLHDGRDSGYWHDYFIDSSSAMLYLKAFTHLPPNSSEILQIMGQYFTYKGDLERAENYLRQAMSIEPDNMDLLVNLTKIHNLRNK